MLTRCSRCLPNEFVINHPVSLGKMINFPDFFLNQNLFLFKNVQEILKRPNDV